MGLFDFLTARFTKRGKLVALYKSGMEKAKNKDFSGAIADYSSALSSPAVPGDLRAMATYNRSLAYDAAGEPEKAAADLSEVLRSPVVPPNIKALAEERRQRVEKRNQRKSTA